MADLTAEQVAAIGVWVNQQAAARERLSVNLTTYIRRLFRTLAGRRFYDEIAVARVARQVSQQVRVGQVATGSMTSAYLDQVFSNMGIDARGGVTLPEQLRGIDPERQWQRPAAEYRRHVKDGLSGLDALARTEERAEVMARDDIALAMREAARQRLVSVDRITGYRRVIHPELSAGGTCGLCIAAADRVYRKAQMLPIHGRCKCEVVPVIEGQADPGKTFNDQDLRDLYAEAVEAAGGNTAEALKRVRFVIVEHGELGPQLRVVGQNVRGPGDVAADTDRAA